jgi:hypothetical protein
MNAITTRQLVRLQTLYNQYERRTISADADKRAARLQWATEACQRPIASFRDFTIEEAARLIEVLHGVLGIPNTPPKRLRDREKAQSAGTEGRRGSGNTVTVASKEDIERINSAVSRLGWSEERFRGWLRSPSSPLKGRTQIRTKGDANRVWWGLKPIMQRAGVWKDEVKASS